ncbi:phosphotriesterase family protein [Streptomyces sp. NPDC001635]
MTESGRHTDGPAGTSARPRRQNAAASRPPLARITPTPSGEPQEIGAIEDTLTPGVERVRRAVAQAHLRTGAPITVHTDAVARTGLVAQEVLRSEGVDPGAVVIGHSGDTTDLDWSSQALTEQMGSVRFR